MGAQVSFDPNAFLGAYPQFNHVVPAQLFNYFSIATGYCKADGTGPVTDQTLLTNMLNLLVAHLCQLLHPPGGAGPPPNLVGRITNASEGSVSVAVQMDLPPGSAQFFGQTEYGIMYWQLSLPYRTMRYTVRRNKRIFNPWPVFRGGWFGP